MIYYYNILARFFNTPIRDYRRQFGKSVQFLKQWEQCLFYHFVMIMFALFFLKLLDELYIIRCMLLAGFCKYVTFAIQNGYVVRNVLFREMLNCFYQKLLFPVTILNFLYSGVWIRQIHEADNAMILNDSSYSICKCHSINGVFSIKDILFAEMLFYISTDFFSGNKIVKQQFLKQCLQPIKTIFSFLCVFSGKVTVKLHPYYYLCVFN